MKTPIPGDPHFKGATPEKLVKALRRKGNRIEPRKTPKQDRFESGLNDQRVK